MSNKTKIFSRFIPRLALESGPKHLEEKMQIVMAISSFVAYIRKPSTFVSTKKTSYFMGKAFYKAFLQIRMCETLTLE